MKRFETPEIEILHFQVEDIITSSGREDELPLEDLQSFALPIIENN